MRLKCTQTVTVLPQLYKGKSFCYLEVGSIKSGNWNGNCHSLLSGTVTNMINNPRGNLPCWFNKQNMFVFFFYLELPVLEIKLKDLKGIKKHYTF